MTDQQKIELIWLLERDENANIEFGITYGQLQRGEYVREDVWKARERDARETRKAIIDYLETI